MRFHSILGFFFVSSLAACSGNDDAASPADSSAGNVVQEAGACEPLGTWLLHYEGDAGAPSDELVLIEPDTGGAAGAVKVTFQDREPEQDACSFPGDAGAGDSGPLHVVGDGAVDEASCTLSAGFSQSWCQSGEQQCQKLALTLKLSGTAGGGSASETGGWCMDQHTSDFTLTAQKQ